MPTVTMTRTLLNINYIAALKDVGKKVVLRNLDEKYFEQYHKAKIKDLCKNYGVVVKYTIHKSVFRIYVIRVHVY